MAGLAAKQIATSASVLDLRFRRSRGAAPGAVGRVPRGCRMDPARIEIRGPDMQTVTCMRTSLALATCLVSILMVAAGASDAAATPLTPFRYEAQAQRHCPDDTVVWLDLRNGIYYSKRQNRYARGGTG